MFDSRAVAMSGHRCKLGLLAVGLCLLLGGLAGCGTTSSVDRDRTEDKQEKTSTSSSSTSTSSSTDDDDEPYFDFDETDTDGVTEDDFTELDNGDMLYEGKDSTGYMDSDGYSYYKNSDGSLEVTDGYGNAVKDYDGDGEVDAMTTDGGATWVDVY